MGYSHHQTSCCPARAGPYLKGGINDFVVHGQQDKVNPDRTGTKMSAHTRLEVGPVRLATVRLRLTSQSLAGRNPEDPFGPVFDQILADRQREADDFYRALTPPSVSPDAVNVMRQAIAGMLWSKQYYYLDADHWLEEHRAHPLHQGAGGRQNGRFQPPETGKENWKDEPLAETSRYL